MRLQNLHKICTVQRSLNILNKTHSPQLSFNLALISLLLAVYHCGDNTTTYKVLKRINHWGFSFYQSYVSVCLDKFITAGYLTKIEAKQPKFNRTFFKYSITPEGLEILNQFELIVRRTRHDLGH